MIHVLAWTLCGLGWFATFSLLRRNEMLRRELVLALLRIAPRESLPILARDLAELSGRVLRPGTIHVTLGELEQEGLVASDPLLCDPYHRRVYAATRHAAALHHNRLSPKSEES